MAELQAAIDDANKHLKGTDNDHKVGALQTLEQELRSIQDEDVGIQALESIASLLKVSLRNGNSRVYTAGLACTLVFFEVADEQWHRLRSEGQATSHLDVVFKSAVNILAVPPGGLLTFLGDAKDSVRATARAALVQAAKTSVAISASDSRLPPDQLPLFILDKLIKEQGFASKNAKVREQSLLYLTELRAACPTLPLRAWMPILVNALEDSDPVVRDVARESVIMIFTAPSVGSAAKADLKKELIKKGVRKTTSDIVLKRTLGSGIASSSSSLTGSPPTTSHGILANDATSNGRRTPSLSGHSLVRPPSVASMGRSPSSGSLPRPSTGGSTSAFKPVRGDRLLKKPKDLTHEEMLANLEAVAAANAPPPSTGEGNVVQVVYIASAKDLEQEFAGMQSCFTGKETEFNWQERERAIFRIRGMLKGDVHHTYRSAFVTSLKGMTEGILKATNSLRTTLAAAGCQLIIELAENLKEGISPIFEPLFAGQLKLASLTKKVIAQASQDSITALLRECPYHPKSMSLLAPMLDQKNIAARGYTAQHLKTLIDKQGKVHREAIESTPNAGLPLLSQMLRKELADASPLVKETGRATFWLVYDIWPELGRNMLDSVDGTTRRALEKADPRTSKDALPSRTQVEGSASARKPASGRPSMRELISSRRAAQLSSSTNGTLPLSASTPPSSSSASPAPAPATSSSDFPSEDTHFSSHSAISQPTTRPQLSSSKTTPTKRPTSFYGAASSSHIPSPPRSNQCSQNSPRIRTFSGDFSQRRNVSQTYKSPPIANRRMTSPAHATTPTQANFTQAQSEPPAMQSASSSRSSSPSLHAPAGNVDYSDIEASTFNAMPDGLDSTDDESVNLLNYRPVALKSHQGHADFDLSERSRILDGLMDTSFDSVDSIEVEEAVKGRAEQAEQTANRFLELTEPEDDAGLDSANETTFVQNASSQDIPVPYTPESQHRFHGGSSHSDNSHIQDAEATPLLERLQKLHLTDSPARSQPAEPAALVLAKFTQDRWWMDKAALALAGASSVSVSDPKGEALRRIAGLIGSSAAESQDFLDLARISKLLTVNSPADVESGKSGSVWDEDRLYEQLLRGVSATLKQNHNADLQFSCLVALLNLVTNQFPLLDGREMELLELLFDISKSNDKTVRLLAVRKVGFSLPLGRQTRIGAETVLISIMERTEPLYGISCLRLALDNLLESHKALNGHSTQAEADILTHGYTMGLKALSALFSVLPSEVLEEEIPRSRDMLLKAMNSPQTSLRQTAATVIVRAHLVIRDDTKLFNLLDGLTKSQMNLCTYLFARSGNAP